MKFIAIGLTCALMSTMKSLKVEHLINDGFDHNRFHNNDAMDHNDDVWENTDNDCSFLD